MILFERYSSFCLIAIYIFIRLWWLFLVDQNACFCSIGVYLFTFVWLFSYKQKKSAQRSHLGSYTNSEVIRHRRILEELRPWRNCYRAGNYMLLIKSHRKLWSYSTYMYNFITITCGRHDKQNWNGIHVSKNDSHASAPRTGKARGSTGAVAGCRDRISATPLARILYSSRDTRGASAASTSSAQKRTR